MDDQLKEIRTVNVTRYITPLREGGSLPAIAEADDGFMYVVKFRGAGQGIRSLIADLLGGEIARMAGLRIPEIVFANLDSAFGRTEPDEEIQELLRKSEGVNLGLHYLTGAISFDPAVNHIASLLASQIVWLDAMLMNVDRTVRNTNMLIWNKQLWLIDHGASLYFHHGGGNWEDQARKPFSAIKEHVLLQQASEIETVDTAMRFILTAERIHRITAMIPEEWLVDNTFNVTATAMRTIYARFLINRIESSSIFVNEAQHARKIFI